MECMQLLQRMVNNIGQGAWDACSKAAPNVSHGVASCEAQPRMGGGGQLLRCRRKAAAAVMQQRLPWLLWVGVTRSGRRCNSRVIPAAVSDVRPGALALL